MKLCKLSNFEPNSSIIYGIEGILPNSIGFIFGPSLYRQMPTYEVRIIYDMVIWLNRYMEKECPASDSVNCFHRFGMYRPQISYN